MIFNDFFTYSTYLNTRVAIGCFVNNGLLTSQGANSQGHWTYRHRIVNKRWSHNS